jgi:phenylalanyl-tRNA synthetase beta chain
MKISYNWLKEILDFNLSPEEAAALLTSTGLEVEGIETFESVKGGMKGLVTGEVLTCVKHPDADKLSLTTVDVGSGEPYSIVCGAPNVAAGQKVIVALPGTKIFPVDGEPFVIKQAKIRGQVSNGMICAEDEIGLGQSHAGIIVLPSNVKTGIPAAEYFKISSDSILEIGLTPNRADAASHVGVARDLAAAIRVKQLIEKGKDVKLSPVMPGADKIKTGFEKKDRKVNYQVQVNVEDSVACPRYSGITISNVTVGDSPEWLKNRLRSIGVNPINNIVDITNYVLHECGQPLHAFDADEIRGKKVVVRSAKENEKFLTLDNVERTMHSGDLLICDEMHAMCIAGVYGGLNSGISSKTKNVFIESACFNPASIRSTGKRHGLKTDASFRFERGTDPEMTLYALKRSALLICEIAGGEIASEVSDYYPLPLKQPVIKLNFNSLDRFTGEKIDRKIISTIIESLEMKILSLNESEIQIEVPHFKVDVLRPADVVEEILRIYGYDRIPIPEKINVSVPADTGYFREHFQDKVSAYLSSNGFNEILNNSLTRQEYVSQSGWDMQSTVSVLNPLSQELSVLRCDLLHGGLETIQYNSNRKQHDLRLFEFGKVYKKTESGYKEEYRLSVIMTGNRQEPSWRVKEADSDFYLLKSFVANILSICGIEGLQQVSGVNSFFASSLSFNKGKEMLVESGIIQRTLLRKFDVSSNVLYAEFNWEAIIKYSRKKPVRYSEISKYPAVKRDLSMLIPSDVSYSKLENIAYGTEKKLLKEVRLFDVYEGEKIGQGKKSYAMSFILEDEEQTLTEQQIGKVMERLMAAFEKEAGAVIRKQ